MAGNQAEGKNFPRSIDVLIASHQIMRKSIIMQKDIRNKIQLYCAPELKGFNSLSFQHSEKIIQSVKQEVENFKKELNLKISAF